MSDQNIEQNEWTPERDSQGVSQSTHLDAMYESWFLDYASYVILERAVPDIRDGLKPVHRRILHAMKEMDDGRFNKVANIIGQTMKYHPHGDASIGDALVQLGQKDLLVETQGNWGNTFTGDRAAAPRYIEARLSKFALEVVFNPKTTDWQLSYDGRNKEPVTLPVKFPLVLAQGVEGIAVGLASKVLPHNFNELIDASIAYLRNEPFEVLPDFPAGGLADFSRYNDGQRGGRVRIRAKISKEDKKTLLISDIPFGTNTTNLIESIVNANEKGKIKIKQIEDNTSDKVEIIIHLPNNVSPDQTIDALYAFTNCEVSISPNACVIENNKPRFLGVTQILKDSTDQTVALLKRELEIQKHELEEQWHFSSLEKIFIEEKIYRNIEEAETYEAIIDVVDKGLEPYKDRFKREITREDIIRLTEIRIKRISKYDSYKADEIIRSIEDDIQDVNYKLEHLIEYAIEYFKRIKKKYGKGRERRTEIRNFENINASQVAVANVRLYVNRKEGFVGTSLRKDEFVMECSDLDELIVFQSDGTYKVTKVSDKSFVGKDIIHVDVYKRNDERTVYNVVYQDGKSNVTYIKRFPVVSVQRNKDYNFTLGTAGTKVLYFSANPNGEAEIVKVRLRPRPRLRKLYFEADFSEYQIKGKQARGNILTKNAVSTVKKKEDGVSTLGAIDIWFDESVRRLNMDENGKYLGAFKGNDRILGFMENGDFMCYGYDLTTHFDEDMFYLEKFDPEKIWTAIYYEGESGYYYVKRFKLFDSAKRISLITEHESSKLVYLSGNSSPQVKIAFDPEKGPRNRDEELVEVNEFIAEKSHKAKGKRLTSYGINNLELIEPEMPEPEDVEDTNSENSDEQSDIQLQETEGMDERNESQKDKEHDDNNGKPDELSQRTLFD
ncbi:MAG: DNA gyrase/topoisomerase IV subunit A [Bacteroidales bacterium]|nr:DNA gyrase/topoisomerase IV subunit A [Bacteroidales bacterium]MCF8327417.1 DNA gyrase/topoisomerase IV subunit A [Bacteroidales bacterium]